MLERSMPGVLLLFVGLTVLQPALFVLLGALDHPNTGGIAFMVVLVLALAREHVGGRRNPSDLPVPSF